MNHGVLIGRRDTDWGAGTLPYEIRNPSGDWSPYFVEKERQHSNNVDTQACVSFSGTTLLEMQIKQQTGVEVNFSDRFLAKMSGTTPYGNWLYVVGDTIRNTGLVLESEWGKPPGNDWGWNEYYASIPPEVMNKAQNFLEKYIVNYEILDVRFGDKVTLIRKHLKHAPLWVVIPGHCVAGVVLKADGQNITYFDSYGEPFVKTAPIALVQSVYKLLLTVKGYTMAKVLNDQGTIRLEFGSGPTGFNIGIASSSIFQQIVASGEPILSQPATTPEKLTLSDGMVVHAKQ
jgi:hypothetical protein